MMQPRYLFYTAVFMFFAVTHASGQAAGGLHAEAVKNDLLAEILNWAEMKEIPLTEPGRQTYFLRLYSIAELGDCAPELETEVTCSFRYYLAVHDGSLGVAGTVYFLGEVGEIRSIERIENRSGPAKLRVEVGNYPLDVLPYNKKLKPILSKHEILVDIDTIKISPVK